MSSYERHAWTPKEDEAVKQLVSQHGTKKWSVIADNLASMRIGVVRTGKQCRTRYFGMEIFCCLFVCFLFLVCFFVCLMLALYVLSKHLNITSFFLLPTSRHLTLQ